jgi:hypothetical protein
MPADRNVLRSCDMFWYAEGRPYKRDLLYRLNSILDLLLNATIPHAIPHSFLPLSSFFAFHGRILRIVCPSLDLTSGEEVTEFAAGSGLQSEPPPPPLTACQVWTSFTLHTSVDGRHSVNARNMAFSVEQCLSYIYIGRSRSLGRCDRGFESHLVHGCLLCVCVYSVLLSCFQVEALRRADHSSKESYRLYIQ